MIVVGIVVAAFVSMEGVSYGTHRWLMHGPGLRWHRSHHRAPTGRFERNDLFPLCFSVIGFALFAGGAWWPRLDEMTWTGVGVTLYGVAYLMVHEVVIHQRIAIPLPQWRYVRWVRDRHRLHHLYGGEPYGMLLPVIPRELRNRHGGLSPGEPLDRSNSRAIRNRL